MIERSVNFARSRRMRCGSCRHEWSVSAEWLECFNQALEGCPVCGTDCRGEDRPDFCADPEDPVQADSAVHDFYWYHSSTHENWPDRNFDPTAPLTDETKRRMEVMGSRVGAVERWAERQKAKALHVGTYEAAIENMFRRMQDQGNSVDQFYLYRVRLNPSCVIQPGVHREPTNFVGDAHLAEDCPPEINVLRYVNVHEDPSRVSLAVEPIAIHSVQRVSLPLFVDATDPWVLNAIARLLDAVSKPPSKPKADSQRWKRPEVSALISEVHRLESEMSSELPLRLRETFRVEFDIKGFEASPAAFPRKVLGLTNLVTNAEAVFDALDTQSWHVCNST